MTTTDQLVVALIAIVVMFFTFLTILAILAFQALDRHLQTISLNQMQLSRNVNTRIGTARMSTGMPNPEQPPQVVETHLIGGGARLKRRVKGGDPESDQYQDLKRGLPAEPEKAGVEE